MSSSVSTAPGAETGAPSTSTTWHPTERLGNARAASTASPNAGSPAFAISVADVTTPSRCASTIARFTPPVRPKSSAFTINCRIPRV